MRMLQNQKRRSAVVSPAAVDVGAITVAVL
jgi:hypothetical protein